MITSLISILPIRLRLWYADHLLLRLGKLDIEGRQLSELLDDVQPGNEDTESFRAHLSRRLSDIAVTRAQLARRLRAIDPLA